jgi:hypothetical protein
VTGAYGLAFLDQFLPDKQTTYIPQFQIAHAFPHMPQTMTELAWRSKMPTENDTRKRQLSYRIISWNTAQACRLILDEAKSRIDRYGYQGSIFEWPADRKAIEWLTNLPTLKNQE